MQKKTPSLFQAVIVLGGFLIMASLQENFNISFLAFLPMIVTKRGDWRNFNCGHGAMD